MQAFLTEESRSLRSGKRRTHRVRRSLVRRERQVRSDAYTIDVSPCRRLVPCHCDDHGGAILLIERNHLYQFSVSGDNTDN